MLWVGFEPTIKVLERAKTVHALDGAATVISRDNIYQSQIWRHMPLMLGTVRGTELVFFW
jgi:hypothetical protein